MEYLLLFATDLPDEARSRLAGIEVVQAASPRLLACKGTVAADALQALHGRIIATAAQLATVRPELTENEQIFADAWLMRQTQGEKERPGDKLKWDTPPFEAP